MSEELPLIFQRESSLDGISQALSGHVFISPLYLKNNFSEHYISGSTDISSGCFPDFLFNFGFTNFTMIFRGVVDVNSFCGVEPYETANIQPLCTYKMAT